MFDRYLIEIHDETAGIIIRNGAHYSFHATNSLFSELEGQTFFGPRDAEIAALRHLNSRNIRANRQQAAKRSQTPR